jgi:hypothetical protein
MYKRKEIMLENRIDIVSMPRKKLVIKNSIFVDSI